MTYDIQSKYKTVISQSISTTLLTQRSRGPAHRRCYDGHSAYLRYEKNLSVSRGDGRRNPKHDVGSMGPEIGAWGPTDTIVIEFPIWGICRIAIV